MENFIFCAADAEIDIQRPAQFPFIYQVIQYCGKPADGNASYYLNATEDYVKHLIESMPASSMKDRIISIASCTHSFPHQIGTLVSNRVG